MKTRLIRISTLFVVMAMVSAGGCGGSSSPPPSGGNDQPPAPEVRNISGVQLQEMLNEGRLMVIIDVRSATEYGGGHIPGSINIPLGQLDDTITNGALNSEMTTVAVCGAGVRSAEAAELLLNSGFGNVYNLEDGLNAWDGEVVTAGG